MTPKNMSDVEYPTQTKHNGTRKDGRNLVQEWIDRTKDKVHFSFSSISSFAFLLSFCQPNCTFNILNFQETLV